MVNDVLYTYVFKSDGINLRFWVRERIQGAAGTIRRYIMSYEREQLKSVRKCGEQQTPLHDLLHDLLPGALPDRKVMGSLNLGSFNSSIKY